MFLFSCVRVEGGGGVGLAAPPPFFWGGGPLNHTQSGSHTEYLNLD